MIVAGEPGRPTALHECRRAWLDAIAILEGFTLRLEALPDGSIPDVLRVDQRRRWLFVGEAKDTESAGSSTTGARLHRYATWLAANGGVFAVCHGGDIRAWRAALLRAIEGANGIVSSIYSRHLDIRSAVTQVRVFRGRGLALRIRSSDRSMDLCADFLHFRATSSCAPDVLRNAHKFRNLPRN